MSELTEKIQEKYIDDITSKIQIHKIVILWIILTTKYSFSYSTPIVSVISTFKNLKIKDVFTLESGPLSYVTVYDLLVAIVLSFIFSVLYEQFRRCSFNLQSKIINFESYMNKLIDIIKLQKSENEATNYFISKDISVELSSLRVKLKSLNFLSETIFCLIICEVISIYYFNLVDFCVLSASILITIYIQFKSYNFYLAKFLPYYVTERTLLGASARFGDE